MLTKERKAREAAGKKQKNGKEMEAKKENESRGSGSQIEKGGIGTTKKTWPTAKENQTGEAAKKQTKYSAGCQRLYVTVGMSASSHFMRGGVLKMNMIQTSNVPGVPALQGYMVPPIAKMYCITQNNTPTLPRGECPCQLEQGAGKNCGKNGVPETIRAVTDAVKNSLAQATPRLKRGCFL